MYTCIGLHRAADDREGAPARRIVIIIYGQSPY